MENNIYFLHSEERFPCSLRKKKNNKFYIKMAVIPLDKNGYALVPATIQNLKNGKEIKLKCLIDTGSNMSVIKKETFDTLELERFKDEAKSSSIGLIKSKNYGYAHIGLTVDNIMDENSMFECVVIVENELSSIEDNRPFDMIIGTNFLELCELKYNGAKKEFDLILVENKI